VTATITARSTSAQEAPYQKRLQPTVFRPAKRLEAFDQFEFIIDGAQTHPSDFWNQVMTIDQITQSSLPG
jgi:hypothetical protein